MKSPFVIFLCGLPLAGKSTFYENHLKQLDHIFISTDAYIERQCKRVGLTYDQGFDLYIKEACDDLMQQLMTSIRYNKSIIIDQTNLNVKSRKKKLRYIPEFYTKVAIYLPTTLDESIQRNTRPGKIIPKIVLESMNDSIKVPTVEEGFDQVFIGVDSFLSVYPNEMLAESDVV